MPRAVPLQSSFSGGEFSPLVHGRVDADRYKTGLGLCLNWIPTVQGPLVRRSGTYFVEEVKNSAKKTRLVRFEFSTTQAYILEFGDLYVRFYKDNGRIESPPGTPVEVTTTYVEADLFALKFTQSADVLYITHPSYAPRKLTRTSHTSWTLTTIDFLDGPYLATNTTATTITPSAATGAGITLTASAALFASTDVGRLIRLKEGSVWGYVKITAFTDTTHVTADVKSTLTNTSAKATWRLGEWSTTTGFPGAVVFYEDRLVFATTQRIDGSKTGDYENFAPTATDGTVAADNAVAFTLNSNDVQVIRWLTSDERGLLVGTVAGEWVVRPSSNAEALSPTNVSAKQTGSCGSANVAPVQVGKATLFVQRAGKKVRELSYAYEVDGFRAPDLTILANTVTGTGLVELAYQKEPQPIVWGVRSDGQLAALTYEREADELRAGWHRHVLGGVSSTAGAAALVESAAVIPSADGTRDELWLVVNRRINGATERYIEYMTQLFQDQDQQDAFFVDSGLTYDVPKTVTDITEANPPVVTSAGHGFSNGDSIRFVGVSGLLDSTGVSVVNDRFFTIANVAANTFELQGENFTTATAYVSGGEARKRVASVSGLDHLEGQTVAILGDGAVQPSQVVASGAVTLAVAASVVQAGLPFTSQGQRLRDEAGAADGTALTKIRRINEVGVLLYRSLGLEVGMSFTALDEVNFRDADDPMDSAPPLFSGVKRLRVEASYDTENEFCFQVAQPVPCTLLAIAPRVVTQDGA